MLANYMQNDVFFVITKSIDTVIMPIADKMLSACETNIQQMASIMYNSSQLSSWHNIFLKVHDYILFYFF